MSEVACSDEWMRGYAAALSAVRRLFHEDTIVREVLIGDGITLAELIEAGAEKFDTDAIRKAIDGQSDGDRAARGVRVERRSKR